MEYRVQLFTTVVLLDSNIYTCILKLAIYTATYEAHAIGNLTYVYLRTYHQMIRGHVSHKNPLKHYKIPSGGLQYTVTQGKFPS